MAFLVANPQIELSLGVILRRGFAEPLHRLHFILRHAKVSQIERNTQHTLGLSIALFRLGADLSQPFADRLTLLSWQLKRPND